MILTSQGSKITCSLIISTNYWSKTQPKSTSPCNPQAQIFTTACRSSMYKIFQMYYQRPSDRTCNCNKLLQLSFEISGPPPHQKKNSQKNPATSRQHIGVVFSAEFTMLYLIVKVYKNNAISFLDRTRAMQPTIRLLKSNTLDRKGSKRNANSQYKESIFIFQQNIESNQYNRPYYSTAKSTIKIKKNSDYYLSCKPAILLKPP